jgi:hypothetical protein
MMDDFQEAFDYACTQAPAAFDRDGYHSNILIVHTGDTHIIPIDYEDDQEKEILYFLLSIAIRGQATWYIQVAEAWYVSRPLDDILGADRPSLNPDRREALLVHAHHRDGRRLSMMWNIRRPESGRPYLEPCDSGQTGWALLDEILLGIEQPASIKIDGNNKLRLND